MSTTAGAATTIALGVATALVKQVVDDLYFELKRLGINVLGRSRATIRDASVARALHSITKVKTLWNIEREVSLYEFYYPATLDFPEAQRKPIASLGELGERQNFVIQGTAGQGKSIFLRYLCGQELSAQQSSGRMPIFVELR